MNFIRRMMYGRYARLDQFNMFLLAVFIISSLVAGILSIFTRRTLLYLLLTGGIIIGIIVLIFRAIQYVSIIIFIIRYMSKNIQRQIDRNNQFLKWWYPISNRISFYKKRREERKRGYELYMCPNCYKHIRVPRGRGRIEITCPACRSTFIRKT